VSLIVAYALSAHVCDSPELVYAPGIFSIVKDRKGTPIPGATVILYDADTHYYCGETVSDAQGLYFLETPSTGYYFLVALYDGLSKVGISGKRKGT
jgi:hypothetical protein